MHLKKQQTPQKSSVSAARRLGDSWPPGAGSPGRAHGWGHRKEVTRRGKSRAKLPGPGRGTWRVPTTGTLRDTPHQGRQQREWTGSGVTRGQHGAFRTCSLGKGARVVGKDTLIGAAGGPCSFLANFFGAPSPGGMAAGRRGWRDRQGTRMCYCPKNTGRSWGGGGTTGTDNGVTQQPLLSPGSGTLGKVLHVTEPQFPPFH